MAKKKLSMEELLKIMNETDKLNKEAALIEAENLETLKAMMKQSTKKKVEISIPLWQLFDFLEHHTELDSSLLGSVQLNYNDTFHHEDFDELESALKSRLN